MFFENYWILLFHNDSRFKDKFTAKSGVNNLRNHQMHTAMFHYINSICKINCTRIC